MTAELGLAQLQAASAELSVVVPLLTEVPSIAELHAHFRRALGPLGRRLEFVYVVDGPWRSTLETLKALRRQGEAVEILTFARPMGEAAALTVGLRHATGAVVATLRPDVEVEAAELPRLVRALETSGADVVSAARRVPGRPALAKLERLLGWLVQSRFKDVRSPVRAMRARVAGELTLYGSQYRFLPLIAQAQGFTVEEVEVSVPSRAVSGLGRLGGDWSLALDVVTIFFLLKFLKKPFRFFGGFGFLTLALGTVATAWLVFERLVLGVPLGDRPALILSSLMVVLGIQIIAVGLIGELVTFAWAREAKDYKVDRIVE